MVIDEVKSLYAEFMGYLSQTPLGKDKLGIDDSQIWEQYNNSVKKLSEVTGRDYSHFFIKTNFSRTFGDFIDTNVYRSKLGGLISKLHAEFFPTFARTLRRWAEHCDYPDPATESAGIYSNGPRCARQNRREITYFIRRQ